MAKRLQLTFKSADGKAQNISISNPKNTLTADDVINACKTITDKKVIVNKDDEAAEMLASAKIIETSVTQLV